MPVMRCTVGNSPGFKYGESGKCYTYTPGNKASRDRARNRAKKQGRAIEREKHMPATQIPSRIRLDCTPDIQAKEGDEATFKIKAYTGSKMNVDGFYDPVIIDLAGMQIGGKSIPILHTHQPDRIVGHSTNVEITGKQVTVEGIVSGIGYSAKEVVQTSQKGFPWQASVGASIEEASYVDEGESVVVNGRRVKGPVIVAQKTRLNEVSFVPLGADQKTSAKVAASFDSDSPSIGVVSMTFDEYVKSLGFDRKDLTEEQATKLQAAFKKQQSPPKKKPPAKKPPVDDPPADPLKASREQMAIEAERVGKINQLVTQPEFSSVPKLAEVQATALREGWTVDKFELECRRAERPKATDVGIHVSSDDLPKSEVLECAVASQCGQFSEEQLDKWYGEEVRATAGHRRYKGAGIHMLFDHVITACGRHYSGSRKSNDYIEAAFRANQEIRANAGFSTAAVDQILENVANKMLIAGYDSVESVWRRICATHSLSDFKPSSRYRLDSEGAFRIVNADGEIKHMALSDDKYTKQLDTYGAILALNRQMIINDDLGAFGDIPRILGRAAAIRQEEAVFVLLLSNPGGFFGAGNNNVLTTVLGIGGLNEAEQIFRDQVDGNGKPILISPRVLLVPTSLKVTADDLYAQTTVDNMALSTTDTVEIARNPHKGKYSPVTTPYLNNTNIQDESGKAIANQSATGWYLFADPRVRAAIAMGLLNGSQVPVLESAQTDFNTLGMQWRAYHDFGVGMEDPKAAVWSDGTV